MEKRIERRFSSASRAGETPIDRRPGSAVGGAILEGRRESEREVAIESDAKAFPQAAGFDEASAGKLSDLRRKDGRNAGMFIYQVAPELGIKPKQLIERLIKMAEYHPKSIATAAALTRAFLGMPQK